MEKPTRTRRYLHPLLNDTQWDELALRDDDIVIASAIKAGTTWLQTIVANLIFQELGVPGPVMDISPWVERYRDETEMHAMLSLLSEQTHRRFLKTHLPLDALRYEPQLKYLLIGRDPRDVFLSLWNHHQHYSSERVQLHRDIGRDIGRPWIEMPNELHAFYRKWIAESCFEWEAEGTPYWSVFYHLASWWKFRGLQNILFIHYNDLLAQPRQEIARIANFLDITVAQTHWPTLLQSVSFDYMKNNGDKIMGRAEQSFKGGSATFIHRGENGLWKSILNDEEKAQYVRAADRSLEPEARLWLEGGKIDP